MKQFGFGSACGYGHGLTFGRGYGNGGSGDAGYGGGHVWRGFMGDDDDDDDDDDDFDETGGGFGFGSADGYGFGGAYGAGVGCADKTVWPGLVFYDDEWVDASAVPADVFQQYLFALAQMDIDI